MHAFEPSSHRQIGRKRPILMALLGGVVQTGGYALVSLLGLPLWVLFISNAVAGCTGGFSLFLMALFAS